MSTTLSSTTALTTTDADHAAARRLLIPVAVIAVAVVLVLSWTRANSVQESILDTIGAVVVGGLLYGLVVPFGLRKPSAGGRALVMGVLGVLLVLPAFWSGLPLLLGGAAALLGAAGRRADRGAGTAIAGLVTGALAIVGYVAIYTIDFVMNH